MINRIKMIDNKLLQAQIYSYLISNKKISKILKGQYIEQFDKLLEELPQFYHTHQYEVDVKSFFNDGLSSNNVVPNFVNTQNYIDYNLTLNYTVKNKNLVEGILLDFDIVHTDENFKMMKKVLSGKIQQANFKTTLGEKNITHQDLIAIKNFKKVYKEELNFILPNSSVSEILRNYPFVFTHVSTTTSKIKFHIFSEENILKTHHYTLPKNKIFSYLNGEDYIRPI